VVFSAGGQRQLSPEEAGRRLFGPVASGGHATGVLLRNGGRLHLDVADRPEYATPEGGSVPDLAVHDKAANGSWKGCSQTSASGCARKATPTISRCSRPASARQAARTAARRTTWSPGAASSAGWPTS
jgi:hypothetical protein